jgi:excisionase family DNA binding protein
VPAPLSRMYGSHEVRPAHPVTGLLADYCAEFPDGRIEPRWSRAKGRSKLPPLGERWYSVTEACQVVGGSRKWLQQAIASGRLHASRPGPRGKWRIRGSDLMAFLDGQSRVANLPKLVVEKETRR